MSPVETQSGTWGARWASIVDFRSVEKGGGIFVIKAAEPAVDFPNMIIWLERTSADGKSFFFIE